MLLNEAPTSPAAARPAPGLNAATLSGTGMPNDLEDSPTMQSPPLDPPVADAAPTDASLPAMTNSIS